MNIKDFRVPPQGHFTSRWGAPEYTDWQDESMSWKETCYIGDWSFLWERRFRGPDAIKLFSDYSINSLTKFAINQSKHLVHTNDAGKVIHEGILTRLGEEEFTLFGRGTFWMDYILRKDGYDVESEAFDSFNFQVSGPKAIEVVERMAAQSMRDVKFMHNARIKVGNCDIVALRQGMAGEIGFELQGDRAYADEVYQAVLDAGAPFGLRRLGGRTVFINHLEACFPTIITDYLPAIFDGDMGEYREEFISSLPQAASTFNLAGSFESNDIRDWYRSPVELGWGKSVKFDHDFMGRAALEEEVANPKRVIRTLVWNAEDIVSVYASLFGKDQPFDFMDIPRDQRGYMYADKVLDKLGNACGISTSRGYSYFFREMLSLCVIDVDQAMLGTEVTLIWGNPGTPQKEIRATVAPAPYKPDNRRAAL